MNNLVPDINLKRIINEYLSRPEETPIRKSDLEKINNYLFSDDSSPKKCVSSLEGLQYAVNLTGLLIENSLLTNVSKIANLEKITTLFFNNNYIKTIPDLSKMTSLSSILLSENEITDVSLLTSAKNLRYIKVNSNMITDLSPLSSLENLREISAINQEVFIKDVIDTSYFYILDISFLKDINGEVPQHIIPSDLGRYNAKNKEVIWEISNISFTPYFEFCTEDSNFSGKINVDIIDLDQPIFIDDELLALEIIHLLNLDDDLITLKDLLKLRALDLTNKGIKSIKGLENANNLYTLILDENYVTDFKYVPTCVTNFSAKNMKNQVSLCDERLKSIVNIQLEKDSDTLITLDDMKNLIILDEPASLIKSLEGLQYATNLKLLSLPNNNISNITPLSKLSNLVYIDLSNNNLSDLSPLGEFYKKAKYIHAYNQEFSIQEKISLHAHIFILSLYFLVDLDNSPISNITTSDNGIYNKDNNTLAWPINTIPCNLSFNFSNSNNNFTGTVYVELLAEDN
ncbi:MAG: hypothetical protein RSG52_13335 [Terrisporobacter sp.]|uniref:leucine-rich repeat domain-containing protein n=1 Tax=Terrisporobacter sp. TaxID=1965305 RepID=UPI002FC78664